MEHLNNFIDSKDAGKRRLASNLAKLTHSGTAGAFVVAFSLG
jgi:hypothetical protein